MKKFLLHLPAALIAEVERWGERNGAGSTAEAIRSLVRRGLDASKPAPRRPAYPPDIAEALAKLGSELEAADEIEVIRKLVRIAEGVNAAADEPAPAGKGKRSTKLFGFL